MRSSVRQTSTTLGAILLLGALTSARGQYLEATIPVGDSPYNLMWSPIGNKVYVANTQDGTVSVIDGATNAVIATILVEDYPDMFALNTVNGKVYCPSGSEDRLNVICAYGDTLIRKVRLSGYPLWPVYNERRNKLYVSGVDDYRLYALDGHADTVVEVLSIRRPMWLSVQRETDRLLVSSTWNSDTLVVVDCGADTVTVRQPLVRHIKSAPRVGPAGTVYVPCESLVEVYSPDCREHLASISTPIYAPRSSAYCPLTAKLYVGDLNRAGIAVVDCQSNEVVRTVAAGEQAYDLICDTISGRLYALCNRKVLVFDTRNDSLRAEVMLSGYSEFLTWNPANRRLYASCYHGNTVFVIRDTVSGLVDDWTGASAQHARANLLLGGITLPPGQQGQLLDASGRKVAELRPGPNDLSRLSPGVYFVVAGRGAMAPRKAVIVR
ncbi:MAG: YncE family protein [bacterium]